MPCDEGCCRHGEPECPKKNASQDDNRGSDRFPWLPHEPHEPNTTGQDDEERQPPRRREDCPTIHAAGAINQHGGAHAYEKQAE